MYVGTPVIAVNDGAGPTETVVDGETGFLCGSDETSFSDVVSKLVGDKNLQKRMGEAGQKRVQTQFSFENFAAQLNRIVSKE